MAIDDGDLNILASEAFSEFDAAEAGAANDDIRQGRYLLSKKPLKR